MNGMLKMAELAERSGVSTGTIKHYLREGVLGPTGDIVRTSRNMAYYPPDFVERIRLIKQLQEDRFLPLRAIRERLAAGEGARTARAEVEARHALPANVLDRLEELGIVTADPDGYRPDDLAILAAIARFRAGGYQEDIGFTVYDTLRYREALTPLVREEVRVLLDRLGHDVPPERAAEIVAAGAEPLRELIGAMHSKLLLAELERARA